MKKSGASYSSIGLILALLLVASCGPSKEEQDAMVQAAYTEKINLLKADLRIKCRIEALRIAEMKADSIIFSMNIDPIQGEDVYRPGVPAKPAFIKTDSTILKSEQNVKPILPSKTSER